MAKRKKKVDRVKRVKPSTKKVKASTKKVKRGHLKNRGEIADAPSQGTSTTPTKRKLDKNGQRRGNPDVPAFKAHQWKPGQRGDTKGRARGPELAKLMKKFLLEEVKLGKEGYKTRAEILMRKVLQIAGTAKGAAQLKQLWDRCEGPVPTKIEGGEEPVRMNFTFTQAVPPPEDEDSEHEDEA